MAEIRDLANGSGMRSRLSLVTASWMACSSAAASVKVWHVNSPAPVAAGAGLYVVGTGLEPARLERRAATKGIMNL